MKTCKYIVTIKMPKGDMISAEWLKDLILCDCNAEDEGRDEVSVVEIPVNDDLEEKARAYDEAFEHARQAYGTGAYDDHTLEAIFPELRESEDERMVRAIEYILYENYYDAAVVEGVEIAEIVTWLEKQKEQKPANYKVGDKIMWDGKEYTIDACYPQPKQEWSEEDEEMINALVSYVKDPSCWKLKCPRHKMLDWLKSLRPRPHWTPREEHLSALLAIINDPNNIWSQTCQLALSDLHEQLKWLKKIEDNANKDNT